ncbi:hypothetical protein [Thalassospira xiamenensis]|jgi:hypothetical protein|uniref:Uncharacterized protein n=1 Tax=Thalassospira xiamenensis TaxID=220697 RepID=A0A367XCG3_9PROT|nr:hypothetical protein [Thalassospira xiamenensis]KZB52388.1 hypothetical protein AUP41_03405 [Thalassospira xiamenensis]MCK2168393.1 hypothetical protein [Thalassospira xiamenensis]RCK51365.1 hypothetical protein TH44_07425 [Thalassospira xiamenensis]
MTDTPLYVSQNYNPHSLTREWGFVLADICPAFTFQSGDLSTARLDIAKNIQASLPKPAANLPNHAGIVSTDTIDNDPASLHQQVGSDIICLTLLADVPFDHPLHITQSSLIGHWRWLRQVWTHLSTQKVSEASRLESPELQRSPKNDVIDEITRGRFNTAIAALRSEFKSLRFPQDASWDLDSRLSFIRNLTLFCPLIGTELLYRLGYEPYGTNHHAKDSEE